MKECRFDVLVGGTGNCVELEIVGFNITELGGLLGLDSVFKVCDGPSG